MDQVYLKKVRNGDLHAFRYFVQQYKNQSMQLAVSILKDLYEAEDAVQEAFISAFKNIDKFKMDAKFSTWLFRIVVNQAFTNLKKRQNSRVDYVEAVETDIEEPDLSGYEAAEQSAMIQNALQKLPPRESLVLRLYYLEEGSVKEVSEISGLTEANVKINLHRARKNMHRILTLLIKKSNQ